MPSRRHPLPSPLTSAGPTEHTAATVARRGLLTGAPALLLAGCGLIGGDEQEADPTGGSRDGGAGAEAAEEQPAENEDQLAGAATVTLDAVVIEDVMDVGDLVEPLTDSETLLHPWAAVTVTGMVLLPELSPERYAELTGEDIPPADEDEDTEATVIRPGDLEAFLIATWESTDSEWTPSPSMTAPSTTLSLAVGGNVETDLARAADGTTEHSGAVLLSVAASPQPAAATVHAEIGDGVQEISLIDGSLVSTAAPRMYSGSLEVEVSDAEVFETEVPDGFAQDVMPLRGSVASAYLTPFVHASPQGGSLGWADEDEIYAVVQLDWESDYSANVDDLSRIVLQLPDGTELTPEQDDSRIFEHHADHIATFVLPAATESAVAEITPRFQQTLDDDFDETHDPITATLTFL